MSTAASATTTLPLGPLRNPTESRGGGGRRRGRGWTRDGPPHNETRRGGTRSERGGPQRARGGAVMMPQPSTSATPAATLKPPSGDRGGGGTSSGRPTGDASIEKGEEEDTEGGDAVEAEVCFICASPVVHQSVAPCNHRTCHICALRMRALYKSRACAHCRTEAKFVTFTDDPVKRFEDFADGDFVESDDILGIHYEKKDIQDDTTLLLRYNCPDSTCDIACYGWPDLHRHVRSIHHKMMCDLCTRNKKVFTHEHDLYTQQELRHHEKFGDALPGEVDQTGFKGHPECGFCRQRFYGDDELFVHCRDKHEKCHVCERSNSGRQQQYYVNYDSLEQHFRKDHFLCADQECLDKKFVVFASEMDLKAHQLEAHPNGLSKDARRDARRVDISAFDYRAPHDERGARNRGRGRDPNSEPLPVSSAQTLRRDEIAYQRQMAIQSAQSVTTRNFGGQLTSTDAYVAGRGREPATVTAPRSGRISTPVPNLASLNLDHSAPLVLDPSSATPQAQPTLQEQARKIQHDAVIDRASAMLHHDSNKINSFRTRVSSYRASSMTASQVVDAFLALFDVPAADLGKLIKELADLYENDGKRNDLLKAWNDWRAVNEDYPTLPGPSGALPSANTASTGRRILKLKSSTAQSSRSAVSQQRSWGTASATYPFPPMPAASANRAGPGRVGPVPWARASSRPPPAAPAPASTAPTASAARAPDAFPALPSASKPNTNIFGVHRGAVRWDDRSTAPINPWGGGAGASAGAGADADGVDEEGHGAGGKKKGKKAKQTLYKFG